MASVCRVLLGGLASGARGWVATCTGRLGVLPPWGVIAVAAPAPPWAPNLHFCNLGVKGMGTLAKTHFNKEWLVASRPQPSIESALLFFNGRWVMGCSRAEN